MVDDKFKSGKNNVLRESEQPKDFVAIKGYDFNSEFDFNKLLDSYSTTGFQASHLAKAIEIINKMRKDNCTIYLGYTSNMVTSGLRDIFRYLVEHKFIDIIITTAGGIEEDFIKCIEPFMLGDFNAEGKLLREKGLNRTGNIFVPNSRYCRFEEWLNPLLEKIYKEQKESGNILTPSDFVNILGEAVNNKDSIYYWANKNKIPVFCPAITDGSIGDMMYFFSYDNPELKIDSVADIRKLNDIAITAKKTGLIILGSGVIKHHILNANMMRNGADYTVYVNTAEEYDGSDAG